jgi:hypothetical protein
MSWLSFSVLVLKVAELPRVTSLRSTCRIPAQPICSIVLIGEFLMSRERNKAKSGSL